jgi:hypothetical protein
MPRIPFTGSCHCRATRYIVFYDLPHTPPAPADGPDNAPRPTGQRFYKCNCTPCQKAGLLHTRVNDPAVDFVVLAPLDPLGDGGGDGDGDGDGSSSSSSSTLATYRCNSGRIAMLFCRTCGGRCFNVAGEGEVVDVDLAALGVGDYVQKRAGAEPNADGLTRVWRPKKGFADGAGRDYLSVNAHSLDARQDGLDLREWHEKEWILYLDFLDKPELQRYGKPYAGGVY